jgi:hypothetical protein
MRTRILQLAVLAALFAATAAAQPRTGPHVARSTPSYLQPSPYQLVLEGGAAIPFGDLGDDYIGTRKGFGAGTGYELGVRFRYYATPTLSLGPSLHFADFGDWEGVSEGAAYAISNSLVRWGLDLQQFFGEDRRGLRPYVTAGVALIRNRYEDWDEDFGTFRSSSSSLALAVGAGLAVGPMEISAVYNHNAMKNRILSDSWGLGNESFDWSHVVVRAGVALGGL